MEEKVTEFLSDLPAGRELTFFPLYRACTSSLPLKTDSLGY
jgi:hypothetical protein